MRKITGIIFISFALFTTQIQAQCKVNNKQFQAGEELTYDLYFKYGLINTKAGVSSLRTVAEKYNNRDVYKLSLVAKSSGMANKVFSLNDTLSSYVTKDLSPLAFVKNAKEGKEHTLENMTYTYHSGGVKVHTKRVKNGELRFDETIESKACVYDLVSVVFYARTLDFSKMKKGDEAKVDFISGKKKAYMIIAYEGIETVKANDDRSYSCIKLVLSVLNANQLAFEDKKEAMRVYITNDDNRMPVRLDSKLNFGSTRAILKKYKGNKYTVKTN